MERTKAERFREVEEKVLVLVAEVGIDGLSLSSVARAADVSRAWIYKYLGGEIPTLVESAAAAFGRRFSGLDNPTPPPGARTPDELREDLEEGVVKTLAEVEQYPWLTQLYFRHLGAADPIGGVIENLEKLYVNRNTPLFSREFNLSEREATEVAALFLKTRMALAHSYRVQASFRALGAQRVAELVVATLPWSR